MFESRNFSISNAEDHNICWQFGLQLADGYQLHQVIFEWIRSRTVHKTNGTLRFYVRSRNSLGLTVGCGKVVCHFMDPFVALVSIWMSVSMQFETCLTGVQCSQLSRKRWGKLSITLVARHKSCILWAAGSASGTTRCHWRKVSLTFEQTLW
jgi:hypothetical protein